MGETQSLRHCCDLELRRAGGSLWSQVNFPGTGWRQYSQSQLRRFQRHGSAGFLEWTSPSPSTGTTMWAIVQHLGISCGESLSLVAQSSKSHDSDFLSSASFVMLKTYWWRPLFNLVTEKAANTLRGCLLQWRWRARSYVQPRQSRAGRTCLAEVTLWHSDSIDYVSTLW